jgi:hypothetical protein
MHEFHSIAVETSLRGIYRGSMLFLGADVLRLIIFTIFLGNAHCLSIQENHEVEVRKASGYVGARLSEQGIHISVKRLLYSLVEIYSLCELMLISHHRQPLETI